MNIIVYIIAGVVGLIIGQFIEWLNIRLPDCKKIFSKEIFTEYNKSFKLNYVLILLNALLYIVLLYKFGITVEFFKYAFLGTCLISVFVIDYKLQIIPNRLNLTIFEVGLIFAFVHGVTSVNQAMDGILGMLVGGGIFLSLTLIGGMIAGKEAMGFGDVKLMGAIRVVFWMYKHNNSLCSSILNWRNIKCSFTYI